MESVPLASLEPRLRKRPGAILAATLQVRFEFTTCLWQLNIY